MPPTEHDDDNTSDEDSIGREENGGDLDINCEGSNGAEGHGIRGNTNLESQNMSVVQALASGVEVAASEGGKVRSFLNIRFLSYISIIQKLPQICTALLFICMPFCFSVSWKKRRR